MIKKKENEKDLQSNGTKMMFSNKYLMKLLWPLFIEQFLVFAVGLLDSVMVASVGEAAVSAVSLVDSVMVLVITVLTALATGGAVVVGQFLGQQKKDNANKAADQLMVFSVILTLAIIVIMYIFKDQFLSLVFGDIEKDVLEYCNTYYIIVVASIPFISIYNSGAALFRSVGNSKASMNVSLLMNIINVTGNAILIFGFHRGVEGVAIPTLISRITAAAVMIALLRNQNRQVHISRGIGVKPDWGFIKKILKIGVPNGVENSMFQLGKLILLSMISGLGTVSIAANAVSNAVSMIAVLPGMAMGYGVVSVISICVGAGDYGQVRFYTKKLLKWVYAAMLLTNVLIMLAMPFIIKIYGLSQETGELASQLIMVNCVSAIFIWPLSFTVPNVLRAAGDVTFTMIVGVASMWIFRIMFGIVLGKYIGLGVLGVWIAMVVDWAVRSICFCLRYHGSRWKNEVIK
ncbi:MATE family efflux transporter [Mogibacterium sp. NSJ-24]|uniref:Probable multidrug resistance protein NorM n=1 Tax=Lentihominibacter hominis TaxID=2763645 RepID=A0A926E8G7_9FIRM|nr:MATE family efflux transporter [Lentihominibacter hominis]MBC8569143.1 MATE family efflux transporter [Lentihominibacter hominis]